MALDIICPHCKKKVIERYRIINVYTDQLEHAAR